MEEKKKSNVGLIVLIVILLLACAGMGAFIFINRDILMSKDKDLTTETLKEVKNSSTEKEIDEKEFDDDINLDMFKDETIKSYYYETKQEGGEKCFMTLDFTNKETNNGFFTIRYISASDTGGEGPLSDGYFVIKDGKLKITVGPYSDSNNEELSETVFKKISANLEVDPEQDWRNSANAPSYYKMYQTTFNETELTIGNKTFYRVN